MIQAIISYLVRQEVIPQEDAAVYAYGLQALFQTAACNGTMLLLAFATHHVIDTLIYWLIFLPLRKYAGGYHSTTPLRCYVLSVAVWTAVMAACRFTCPPALWIITAVSAVVLWRFAPLPHPNNPVSTKRLREVTAIVHILLTVICICFVSLMALHQLHFAALTCDTLLVCALSLLTARRTQSHA